MTPTADFTSHLDDLVEPEPNSRRAAILEAEVPVGDWREEYNKSKPHSAHASLTRVEFVEAGLHRKAHQLA